MGKKIIAKDQFRENLLELIDFETPWQSWVL